MCYHGYKYIYIDNVLNKNLWYVIISINTNKIIQKFNLYIVTFS